MNFIVHPLLKVLKIGLFTQLRPKMPEKEVMPQNRDFGVGGQFQIFYLTGLFPLLSRVQIQVYLQNQKPISSARWSKQNRNSLQCKNLDSGLTEK